MHGFLFLSAEEIGPAKLVSYFSSLVAEFPCRMSSMRCCALFLYSSHYHQPLSSNLLQVTLNDFLASSPSSLLLLSLHFEEQVSVRLEAFLHHVSVLSDSSVIWSLQELLCLHRNMFTQMNSITRWFSWSINRNSVIRHCHTCINLNLFLLCPLTDCMHLNNSNPCNRVMIHFWVYVKVEKTIALV